MHYNGNLRERKMLGDPENDDHFSFKNSNRPCRLIQMGATTIYSGGGRAQDKCFYSGAKNIF
jgi:hypothetical protein